MNDGNGAAPLPEREMPVAPDHAGGADVARYQRKAAELVMDDESWRSDLDDATATPLLEWALAHVDASLARAAGAAGEADVAGGDLTEQAYAAADQARALLRTLAALWRGRPAADVWRDLEALLGPPLFASPGAGRAAVQQALAAAGRAPPGEPGAQP
jgi:hypothetical protein